MPFFPDNKSCAQKCWDKLMGNRILQKIFERAYVIYCTSGLFYFPKPSCCLRKFVSPCNLRPSSGRESWQSISGQVNRCKALWERSKHRPCSHLRHKVSFSTCLREWSQVQATKRLLVHSDIQNSPHARKVIYMSEPPESLLLNEL